MNKAEEFLKDYDLVEPNQFLESYTKPNVDLETLLKNYHKSRVNAISDEEIVAHNGDLIGAKWFKQQLLKQ